MEYSQYDLKAVSNEMSKMYKYKFELEQNGEGDLNLYVIKVVTVGRNDNKNITLAYAKDYSKGIKIGDTVKMEYDEDDRDSLLSLAESKLKSLENERAVFQNTSERLDQLSSEGIIKGALIKCTIDKVLPLGDIVLKCDRIPDVKINMSRDQIINEVYDYESGAEIYVVITKITSIGNNIIINVSRRSTLLIKELILQSTLFNDTEGIEVVNLARIPDRGSRVLIRGPFSKFIGKSGSNVRGISSLINNEFIRFLQWDDRTPQLLINTLQYDCSILDIYYPEESQDGRWHIITSLPDIKKTLKNNKEALIFTKLLIGIQPWMEDESYLANEHLPYRYQGTMLNSENEVIKRYYAYKFDKLNLLTDEDIIHNLNLLKDEFNTYDVDYIKFMLDQSYSKVCPHCETELGATEEYCHACGESV